MKEFFNNDSNKSMGRLLAFIATISGIATGCAISIIVSIKSGDIGTNTAVFLGSLVALGVGGKVAQKVAERKKVK